MSTNPEQVERQSEPEAMLGEARRIVDAARARGLTLRLIGGLAVREQCRGADATAQGPGSADVGARGHDSTYASERRNGRTDGGERQYRDIDLVCLRPELKQVVSLLSGTGFTENVHFRLASSGQMAQFFRPCVHRRSDGRAQHIDDRIDLFVDTFRLDHHIALKARLGLSSYTVPPSDVLLAKLQRASVNEDDLGDIIALLSRLPLIDDGGGAAIDPRYIAGLCARDWGLHHDVTRNLERCRAQLARSELDDSARKRVSAALDELAATIRVAPKSLRWRMRSLFGETLPWHDTVDERDGARIGRLERL